MYLLIDLSEKDLIHLALFDESTLKNFESAGRNRELLSCLDTFFAEQKFVVKNLQGIMAVVGKGSFTNTRISAVTANTFGFALNIPLLAIDAEQISKVQQLIPHLLEQKTGLYISAIYSAPPNIG